MGSEKIRPFHPLMRTMLAIVLVLGSGLPITRCDYFEDFWSSEEVTTTTEAGRTLLRWRGSMVRLNKELDLLLKTTSRPSYYYYLPRTTTHPPVRKPYRLTSERLGTIRSDLLYPIPTTEEFYLSSDSFLGKLDNNRRDLVLGILILDLPFFGKKYNRIFEVSLHGHVALRPGKYSATHPFVFPNPAYPKEFDPSIIAPLYSEFKIRAEPSDGDKTAGVYLQVERHLGSRTDEIGVELRERSKWDVREGIVGAESFQPEHVIVATWRNVSFFAGDSNSGNETTATFQAVIVTDETRTYVIYNYEHIGTTPPETMNGGKIAFVAVGFNAGNGSAAFEYAKSENVRNLLTSGNVNGFPGRHIFRVDEAILPGQCAGNDSDKGRLIVAPESGNMLGGTIVNVTGPCFNSSREYYCRFQNTKVKAVVINGNRASCLMPQIFGSGYIQISVGVEGNGTAGAEWLAKFFVESPTRSPELVRFPNIDIRKRKLSTISWDYKNLTVNRDTLVTLEVWEYRENLNFSGSSIVLVGTLAEAIPNSGRHEIGNSSKLEKLGEELFDSNRVALVSVRFANVSAGELNPILWSRPVPLVLFYVNTGINDATCQEWLARERQRPNFTAQLTKCPCTLTQAVNDVGRYLPDPECDKDGRFSNCGLNQNAKHCVQLAIPSESGASQQCCYDIFGDLMLSYDNVWGGKPRRSHAAGAQPFNEIYKVPTLSHYLHDIAPFYSCCVWNSETSPGCYAFREEVRVSENCVGYDPPGLATVFGSLHFYTFDGVAFTFNPKGEFVLLKSNLSSNLLEIQGRFEQLPPREDGSAVNSTQLTIIAVREGNSATVEVRLRPVEARWRYKLDVLVDGEKVFFDRQKVQNFAGLTVHTPTYVLNQSVVIVTFKSGAGVEVIENKGNTAARIYLPTSFKNTTTGLFGKWDNVLQGEFPLPDGTEVATEITYDSKRLYHNFGRYWKVLENESLFSYPPRRSSLDYSDPDFVPVSSLEVPKILSDQGGRPNLTYTMVEDFCGHSYQCKFDYAITGDRWAAHFTKVYQWEYKNVRNNALKPVVSCGWLPTPRNGDKSTFRFTPGTMVEFECDRGYYLLGATRRYCSSTGEWTYPKSEFWRYGNEWGHAVNYTEGVTKCVSE